MTKPSSWIDGLSAAVTVTDAQGTILEMNERSRATFAKSGGGELVGRPVFACHPPHVQAKLEALYSGHAPNSYTIRKNGQKKIVHQLPWFENGVFAGYVELSVPIPDEVPHFERG